MNRKTKQFSNKKRTQFNLEIIKIKHQQKKYSKFGY